MKLADAIRLGAMLKPQCTQALTDGVGTCAIGAALDAVGDSTHEIFGWTAARRRWPVMNLVVMHPEGHGTFPAGTIAADLNDQAQWTREQIADWVEGIENQAVPVCAPSVGSEVGQLVGVGAESQAI